MFLVLVIFGSLNNFKLSINVCLAIVRLSPINSGALSLVNGRSHIAMPRKKQPISSLSKAFLTALENVDLLCDRAEEGEPGMHPKDLRKNIFI